MSKILAKILTSSYIWPSSSALWFHIARCFKLFFQIASVHCILVISIRLINMFPSHGIDEPIGQNWLNYVSHQTTNLGLQYEKHFCFSSNYWLSRKFFLMYSVLSIEEFLDNSCCLKKTCFLQPIYPKVEVYSLVRFFRVPCCFFVTVPKPPVMIGKIMTLSTSLMKHLRTSYSKSA